MHILQVTATYSPSINGVAVVINNLKNELEKLGHSVTVLAPHNPKANKEMKVIRFASLNNPFEKDYPIPLLPGISSITKLLKNEKPDIIHVHHPFHTGYLAKLLAKYYKCPLVFTYHTDYNYYAEKYLEFLPQTLKKRFLENQIEKFCQTSDVVIAPSHFIEKKLKTFLPKKRVVTIPSGVPDLGKSKLPKRVLRKKLDLPCNKILLLTVCRLSPAKNLDILINSIQYLPPKFNLVLVGDGPEKKRLIKLVKKHEIVERVYFVGKVQRNKIHKYYQATDYFYYSSVSENQGLIFLEAISLGLPIVSVLSNAVKEWTLPGFRELTENSPESLASGVKKMEQRDYRKMSKSAQEFSRNFSGDKLVKRLVKTYQDIQRVSA